MSELFISSFPIKNFSNCNYKIRSWEEWIETHSLKSLLEVETSACCIILNTEFQLSIPIIGLHVSAMQFNLAKWISGPMIACSSNYRKPPHRHQLALRTSQYIMYHKCFAGGFNVWSICNKKLIKHSVFCHWNEFQKTNLQCVSLDMMSVYPCRNKLFKARNWKWGGGGQLAQKDTKTEMERGKEGEDEANPSGREETERVYDSLA